LQGLGLPCINTLSTKSNVPWHRRLHAVKTGIVLLALIPVVFGVAQAKKLHAPQAAAACIGAATASSSDHYVHLAMKRTAERTQSDPSGIWSNWDIWNPYSPEKTDIWEGSYPLCGGGQVVVSQIVNRQCTSPSACPTRVVVRHAPGSVDKTLISYTQACTVHETFMLRQDGSQLTACDQPFNW
jgi:hypothetical protein